jgi:hypothetical protein
MRRRGLTLAVAGPGRGRNFDRRSRRSEIERPRGYEIAAPERPRDCEIAAPLHRDVPYPNGRPIPAGSAGAGGPPGTGVVRRLEFWRRRQSNRRPGVGCQSREGGRACFSDPNGGHGSAGVRRRSPWRLRAERRAASVRSTDSDRIRSDDDRRSHNRRHPGLRGLPCRARAERPRRGRRLGRPGLAAQPRARLQGEVTNRSAGGVSLSPTATRTASSLSSMRRAAPPRHRSASGARGRCSGRSEPASRCRAVARS